MPVPYMAGALNGWTNNISVKIITQTISGHKTVESAAEEILDINLQPVPAQRVERKPEYQREWKWWSLIIKNGPLLKIDDIIIVNSIRYKIQSVSNWASSGFHKYEAIEDYEVST